MCWIRCLLKQHCSVFWLFHPFPLKCWLHKKTNPPQKRTLHLNKCVHVFHWFCVCVSSRLCIHEELNPKWTVNFVFTKVYSAVLPPPFCWGQQQVSKQWSLTSWSRLNLRPEAFISLRRRRQLSASFDGLSVWHHFPSPSDYIICIFMQSCTTLSFSCCTPALLLLFPFFHIYTIYEICEFQSIWKNDNEVSALAF